jgi:putative ABC transport system substrate-binding protein
MGGLIKDISRPGRNVTGFASLEMDISGKFFEILQQLVPSLRRIAVLAPRPVWETFAPAQDKAARALGIEYDFIDMPSPESVGAAMDQAVAQGAQAAIVRGSPFFSSAQRRLIIDNAAAHRLPVLYERREDAQRGGLASYAADVKGQYGATAEYVVRILAGANPAELPIQQPTKFDLVINMKTAKTLGLTIPPSVLARADEVIE